jgi:hypothetical protein
LLLVGFVAECVQTYLLQVVGQRIMHRLRTQVYARFRSSRSSTSITTRWAGS